MSLRLTPAQSSILAQLADADGISPEEATIRAIEQVSAIRLQGRGLELSLADRERLSTLPDFVDPRSPSMRRHYPQCDTCQRATSGEHLCFFGKKLAAEQIAKVRLKAGMSAVDRQRFAGLIEVIDQQPSNLQTHYEVCPTRQTASNTGKGLCRLGQRLVAQHDLAYK